MDNEPINTADHPMPPKVAAAVAAVMADVPKLAKGEKNQHGNYNFASIDDFLEAVRPLCAKHGLIIVQDEESFDMRETVDKFGKPKVWLLMRFAFTLAHASGETWGHSPKRSIMVDGSMGSQAFGAAQSYVLKQFERSLFQIATGEKGQDADEHPAGDLPTSRGSTITQEQADTIRALVDEVGADMPAFLKYLGCAKVDDLPASSYDKAVAALEKKRGRDESRID